MADSDWRTGSIVGKTFEKLGHEREASMEGG